MQGSWRPNSPSSTTRRRRSSVGSTSGIEQGFFRSEPDPDRTPYTIVIPPPNVTGALHMGHALNNTLQDVLIRWRRMPRATTPSTCPAPTTPASPPRPWWNGGIREEEKKTRHDLGREELVRRIWQWKDQYEARILGQLRSLGCSCDWTRTRFTLDPICAGPCARRSSRCSATGSSSVANGW